MAITQQNLVDLKTRLEGLKTHLGNHPLDELNAGSAADNLEALKNQVIALQFEVGEDADQQLTEDEWGYLGVQELGDDNAVEAATATSMVTDALADAIAKIDTCIGLSNDQLFKAGDGLAAFFGKSKEDLAKYASAAEGLNSENFAKLGEDFDGIFKSIKNINTGLDNLKPENLQKIFNTAANSQNAGAAQAAFITALKKDTGLGHILSADAKAAEESADQQTKFQKQFDEAAADLFKSCARIAKKGDDGNFIENSLELNASNGQAILEAVKAFVGALVKHALIIPAALEYAGVGKDFLQSDRAKRAEAREAADTFAKLLGDTDARNQLMNDNAKSVSIL